MFNLIEYSDCYSITSVSLWQYYRDEPFLNANVTIADFLADNNNSISFEFKTNIAGRTENDGVKDDVLKDYVLLKYLGNIWRTLEMPLINCEINFILTSSVNCFIIGDSVNNQVPTFAITYIKLYVPVVTLSNQDDAKPLQ